MNSRITFGINKINLDPNTIVSEIDYKKLHMFILRNVSNELSGLTGDCYYPKIAALFKDLLHLTNSNEDVLIAYSKKKYANPKYKLLHDPQTTLLILIIQQFLSIKDIGAAMATFHLFSVRTYTNTLYTFIKYCNPEYFRSALNMLSKNHLFVVKQTIGSSIMYLSNELFAKHRLSLERDDADEIHKLIYEIRTRFFQSVRSFAEKYYKVSQGIGVIKSEEEKEYDPTFERKIRQFIENIVKDIAIFKHIDDRAREDSQHLTKFNRKLSHLYVEKISQPIYTEKLKSILYLMLIPIKDFTIVTNIKFLEHIKKLMSVKISIQEVYFKKIVSQVHDDIIKSLNLTKWFNDLSIQSKAISRNFVAYYLAFFVRDYVSESVKKI